MAGKHAAEPVLCNVFGVITKEDDVHFQITTWAVEQDEEGSDMNDECFCIVKSAVVQMRQLSAGKWLKRPKVSKKSGSKRNKRSKHR
jgi:hypothetical protein